MKPIIIERKDLGLRITIEILDETRVKKLPAILHDQTYDKIPAKVWDAVRYISSKYDNLNLLYLVSTTNKQTAKVRARWHLWYYLNEFNGWNTNQMAEMFGIDHTTIAKGIAKHKLKYGPTPSK